MVRIAYAFASVVSAFSLCLTFQPALANEASQPPAAKNGKIIFETTGNVTRATFNNPPVNLVDASLIADLADFLRWLQPSSNRTDIPAKVVVFASNNTDFFLDHIDFNLIVEPITQQKFTALTPYEDIVFFLQNTTSVIFIAEMDGRANGAGQELAVQMDMRFAGPNVRAGSFENALGLTAGGGGQLFLPLFVNKGRALEYLLAAKAFDAKTGVEFGLFNQAFDNGTALRTYVDELAARIGQYPLTGLNATKSALAAAYNPTLPEMDNDLTTFFEIIPDVPEQALVTAALAASDNQTASAFELGLPDSIPQMLYGNSSGAGK